MRGAILISFLSVSIAGCKQDHPAPGGAPPAALVAASKPASAAPRVVPLTTASAEARTAYEQAERLLLDFRSVEARPLYERAVAADPGFAEAHVGLAMVSDGEVRTQHEARAKEIAATLAEPERQWVEAQAARLSGQPDVVARLLQVAALAPDDWRVQLSLGDELHAHGDLPAARAAFERAIQLAPAVGNPHNGLAYVLASQGDLEGAARAITRYAEMSPGLANPLDSKGDILLLGGKLDEAEQAFRAALAVDPDSRSDDGIAAVQLHRGDLPAGLATLEQALARTERTDTRWGLVQGVIWTHMLAGHDDLALAQVGSLEKIGADRRMYLPAVSAQAMRARLLLTLGRWPEAIKIIDAAIATVRAAAVDPRAPADRHAAGLLRRLSVQRLRAALGAGDSATADKLSAALLAEKSDDELAQLTTLLMARRQGDVAAATAAAKALAGSRELADEAKLIAAEVLAANGKPAEAAALRQEIAHTYRRDARGIFLRRLAERALAS